MRTQRTELFYPLQSRYEKRGFDVFKIIHCSDAKIKKLLLAWLHGCHHCLAVRTSFDWIGLTEIHFIQSNYL
mgnify:CR=1 FL=1